MGRMETEGLEHSLTNDVSWRLVMDMDTKLKRAFIKFFPFVIVVTFLSVLSYGIGQQVLRQTADDTQVQMAEDAASLLSAGQQTDSVVSGQKIDMSKSLAPFLIVYDAQGQVVAASGAINGKVPSLPSGVLDSARSGEDHITWQPSGAVRDAVVVVAYNGKQSGFVLAGKSLREVEKHESEITTMVFLMWAVCLVVLYLYFLFGEYVREDKVKRSTHFKGKRI